MSFSLKNNPIEIPELLHVIGCHLSTRDQKACMLVSRAWCSFFRAFYWHHLIYIRQSGIPYLEKYGHLVRHLTAYTANDIDLITLSGSCHLVQRLDLDLRFTASINGLEILTSNMPHVQELRLWVDRGIELKHMVAITQWKRLRTLRIGHNGSVGTSCDITLLLKVLQECPTLTCLQLDRVHASRVQIPTLPQRLSGEAVIVGTPEIPTGISTTTSAEVTQEVVAAGRAEEGNASMPRPTRAAKWLHWIRIKRSTGKRVTTASKSKEPWRKFTVLKPYTIRPGKIPMGLLQLTPDASILHPRLTRLQFTGVWIDESLRDIPVSLLFEKSPSLQDLNIAFRMLPYYVNQILDAITNHCHELQTLAIGHLQSNRDTKPSIYRFFRQHRPNLMQLTLESCEAMDDVLALIPTATVAGLRRVCFDTSIYSHGAFHRFMARAASLQSLSWTSEAERYEGTGGPEEAERKLDCYLEPWACYETIRSVEQKRCIDGSSCFAAFSERLAKMKRLVCLSMSIEDLLLLVAAMLGLDKKSLDCSVLQRSHKSCVSIRDHSEDDDDSDMKAWSSLRSVQELVLGPIRVDRMTRMLLTDQLDATKVRMVIEAFPKLRKLRYQGRIFPLDDDARKALESLSDRSIMVVHVSQLPSYTF
ncbi:hypothetical protein BX616_001601 [Lobosporangium transversale]|uniref:F-box domain-containing protein n=1 Tax=Lobosporangium transversale TaxID=64571 RepID=A0A1Y2G575_9FUNG|nr:hypothetical protein BCR41DRAFT_365382 [Lobosporangium transversale]KAF9903513.1 hypothetical protein BX616_001601 [Lobosporangium transversale]ORY94309.1 hypothetical protein BCR41DRAFT_365382 [Lobosporangium transversale]|eukprot:XP_021875252.1 hypothetical protein BCR41DRAFT_365382 [Lobosporangium transversale]